MERSVLRVVPRWQPAKVDMVLSTTYKVERLEVGRARKRPFSWFGMTPKDLR